MSRFSEYHLISSILGHHSFLFLVILCWVFFMGRILKMHEWTEQDLEITYVFSRGIFKLVPLVP